MSAAWRWPRRRRSEHGCAAGRRGPSARRHDPARGARALGPSLDLRATARWGRGADDRGSVARHGRGSARGDHDRGGDRGRGAAVPQAGSGFFGDLRRPLGEPSRRGGVHNGPTLKPIELRVGIIEHMTPDMARIVGELSAYGGSRGLERTLVVTGLVPPSRAFLAKGTTEMGRSIAAVILNGAPPFLPRARAEANPALVRSDINSRSNSARAAKIPKTSLPAASVVSIAAPWPVKTLNPILRCVRSWTVFTRWRRFRPSRSSFHTTSTSPPRRALSAASKPGLASLRPDARSS